MIKFEEKMTQTKITVDNLPKGAYEKFAEDQAVYERKYVEDARYIPDQTEVNVTSPFTSAFDEFSGLNQCRQPFSRFEPPPGYDQQRARFFRREIVPGIDAERLDQFFFQDDENFFGENEEEINAPLSLLVKELHTLQRLLETINAHVRQFQKA